MDSLESTRLEKLRIEFTSFLEFHANSFKEIDDKSRYWLTLCFPVWAATFGVLIQGKVIVSPSLFDAAVAFSLCVAISMYLFASVSWSTPVLSGFIAPVANPESTLANTISDDEAWKEFELEQAKELLRALAQNSASNQRKSCRLGKAEFSLFILTPISACAAASWEFTNPASSPIIPLDHGRGSNLLNALIGTDLLPGVLSTVASATILFLIRHHYIFSKSVSGGRYFND